MKRLIVMLFVLSVMAWQTDRANAADCAASDYTCAQIETLLDTVNAGVEPTITADSIATLTDIAAALKSGGDATLVTGTAGTNTYYGMWNAGGDLVDGAGVPALQSILGTSIGNGLRLDTAVLKADREFRALSFDNAETQTAFSAANMLLYGTINNQGADEETDIILPTPTFPIKFEVEVSEDHIIELCPAAGEIFTLNGTALDANDCVDSSAVVGDCFMVKSRQIAAGTWQYFIYTIQGAHLDTGAGDD